MKQDVDPRAYARVSGILYLTIKAWRALEAHP